MPAEVHRGSTPSRRLLFRSMLPLRPRLSLPGILLFFPLLPGPFGVDYYPYSCSDAKRIETLHDLLPIEMRGIFQERCTRGRILEGLKKVMVVEQ